MNKITRRMLGFLIPGAAFGTTKVNADQLRFSAIKPSVLVCMPDSEENMQTKTLIPVILDEDYLGIFKEGSEYFLRVKNKSSPPKIYPYKLTTAQTSFSITPHSVLVVIRNGLTLTEGEDYTVDGTIVNFLPGQIPQELDNIRFHIWS